MHCALGIGGDLCHKIEGDMARDLSLGSSSGGSEKEHYCRYLRNRYVQGFYYSWQIFS